VLLLAAVVIGVLTVPLFGGKLSALAHVRLRWVPLIFGALAIQVLVMMVFPDGNPVVLGLLHVGSYAVAAGFVYANRHITGILVVGFGALLNVVAITANGGVMPASGSAMRAAGVLPTTQEFTNSAAVAHPRLLFLGDVFAIPRGWPLHNVFSIGDILIVVGIVITIHALCRGSENLAPMSDGDGLGARTRPELLQDVRYVGTNGAAADDQRVGDVGVRQTVGKQP
jgi:Family of unknown function (DUF5317)